MTSSTSEEARRTSPLALWRYAHDYLRAAQGLCRQDRVACDESQAPYHVAAQGLEFALAAYLRARGATMTELRTGIRHSLSKALAACEAQGMPPVPAGWRATIAEVAACHQDRQFVHAMTTDDMFVNVEPLVDAGVWILDRIAPDVAEHYVVHLADEPSPPSAELVHRLRADLSATSGVVAHPQTGA